MQKILMNCLSSKTYCFILVTLTIWSATALASGTDIISDKISLTAKDDPLSTVLEMIAEKSGYVIASDPEFADLPVSVSFQELTLEQALWRVLGKLNRYVIINETERKISFKLVDHPGGPVSTPLNQKNPLDTEAELVPPDESGQGSVTHSGIRHMRKGKSPPNQEDIELVPPETAGNKPMTMKDMKAKQYNDVDLEIIPPDGSDEKGLSLKEIEKLKAKQQKP